MAGFPPIRVMLNISGVQLRQSDFVESVFRVLTDVGLDPQHVEFELTESVIMENAEMAIASFRALKEKGIQLCIDDFGAGYSSLSYLKKFPIHTLKIDRSFVQDLDHDPQSAAIIKSIISLAHNLNLRVVAEGVETGGDGRTDGFPTGMRMRSGARFLHSCPGAERRPRPDLAEGDCFESVLRLRQRSLQFATKGVESRDSQHIVANI